MRGEDHKLKRHQDGPHSQTLPRSLQVNSNVMDARLSHRLIHLQPATTSTFKRRTGQKHTQNSEHNATHSDRYYAANDTQAATNCDTLERKINVCESGRFDMNLHVASSLTTGPYLYDKANVNPFNYQSNPVDRDSSARDLELSENVHVREPQINNNPLPPRMNHDFDNYDVTTFSQYAFNTL